MWRNPESEPRDKTGARVDGSRDHGGVVLDYDAERKFLGIDVDNAGQRIDPKKLTLNKLPAIIQTNPA